MMIVIGASLGGTQVLRTIFRALPKTFSHPIAITLHRSRDTEDGALTDLLQRETELPVTEPLDKEAILTGHIYLAPPDYHLLVEPSFFSLSTDEPVLHARPSVDVLFESAADAFGEQAVGVVLTGASQDGAHGAVRLKARKGVVVVQDPATAESAIMPQAALTATGTTHVYSPREIGLFLARLGTTASPRMDRFV